MIGFRPVALYALFSLVTLSSMIVPGAKIAGATWVPEAQLVDGAVSWGRIPVEVGRPAELDLAIETVVIERVWGECAESFAAVLAQDFVDGGVAVLNRGDLRVSLGSADYGSGSVYPAGRIRGMYGVTVSLAVEVMRCDWHQERTVGVDAFGYEVPMYTTEAILTTNVDVTDLATGEYLLSVGSDLDRRQENPAAGGVVDYPVVAGVLDLAYRDASRRVVRALLPWAERREVFLYGHEECRMRETREALSMGRPERAMDVAKAGLWSCRNSPGARREMIARALYNAGMMSLIFGWDEEALQFLEEAYALGSGEWASVELEGLRGRLRGSREARRRMDALRAEARRWGSEAGYSRAEAPGNTLTNRKIVKFVLSGIGESSVIRMIRNLPGNFDTTDRGIAELERAGVSPGIIDAMVERMEGR